MQFANIIIIDFGSQYTQLIARRIREAGVFSRVLFPNCSLSELKALNPNGVILSGGPMSAYGMDAIHLAKAIITLGVPVLGICYGMQMLAHEFGGKVIPGERAEYGRSKLKLENKCDLFIDIDQDIFSVWMSHGDRLDDLPPGFEVSATSDNSPIAAMFNAEKHLYAIQFHPEVTHTEYGVKIIENFLFQICKCKPDWFPRDIVEESIEDIRNKVGGEKVILALSGGVDSSVAAMLLHQAIGKNLICVFVDTGLLRFNEAREVMATFEKSFDLKVIHVDAKFKFLNALKGVVDPEEKRKIIGNLFIEIFEEEANKLDGICFLAQGTIYPDVIESAGSQFAKVIKSHHNVGGLPERMNMKLVEPLRDLFKDEVRKVGELLGLPRALVYRHPFPGPGLAVRILGEVNEHYVDILQRADRIFIETLREHGLYDQCAQAFVVFMPVMSVGVVGDNRQYGYVVAIRAVETSDFMTADWAHLSHSFLSLVSNRIVNEISEIARVVYDITSKPPATIEWE